MRHARAPDELERSVTVGVADRQRRRAVILRSDAEQRVESLRAHVVAVGVDGAPLRVTGDDFGARVAGNVLDPQFGDPAAVAIRQSREAAICSARCRREPRSIRPGHDFTDVVAVEVTERHCAAELGPIRPLVAST